MKQHRFFQDIHFQVGALITLTEQVTSHVARVLRMKEGDEICLFNGRNQECIARLIEVKKRLVNVELIQVKEITRESPFQIILVQALSKGDRFDLVVQKAVELGVTKLIPIITERNSVRLDENKRQKKLSLWQNIIESASEQCGRNQLMQLSDIISFDEYIKNKEDFEHFVLDPYSQKSLNQKEKPSNGAVFLIGPEGGFSDTEIKQLTQIGVQAVCFGPRILRTETAAIAVCSIAQILWGDLS